MTPVRFRNLQSLRISVAFIGCLAAGCIFDGDQPVTPLSMQYIGNQGDTVSPLAVLRFAFSDSLASPLDFDFSPPVAQLYSIALNPGNDTATISFVEMLPGNTKYVLNLKTTITSKNGSTLSPGNDSTVVYTGEKEREPNNTPKTADTVAFSAVYGMLADAADTDVYRVGSPQNAFYFEAFTDQTSFSVKDSMLSDVSVSGGFGPIDTFTVPDNTRFPLYIFVFSPIKGTVGYYKFGIISQ
jgi:hypothetical protein